MSGKISKSTLKDKISVQNKTNMLNVIFLHECVEKTKDLARGFVHRAENEQIISVQT